MARIFHCAPCLAGIILGGQWDPDLPKHFMITPERLTKLKARVSANPDATDPVDSHPQEPSPSVATAPPVRMTKA